jgi:hypothetical protein
MTQEKQQDYHQGKDVELGRRGHFQGTVPKFPGKFEDKHENS